jgi:hypothetical protein
MNILTYHRKKMELIISDQEIHFDANNKTQSGKYIPLERYSTATSMSAITTREISSCERE